jgi:hypothetical protein
MEPQENPKETENENIAFTDSEIFTEIWTSPRVVFKFIHEYRYEKFLYIILILAGIVRAFDRASVKGMGDRFSLTAIIIMCVLIGGGVGWIAYYIYAAMLSWTGKWLDGRAKTSALYRVVGYSLIPAIVGGLLLIPQIAISGVDVFQSDVDLTENGTVATAVYYLSIAGEFVFGFWTIALLVVGISEIQGFSIGKALLNVILPIIIIILPLAAIAFILGDLFS